MDLHLTKVMVIPQVLWQFVAADRLLIQRTRITTFPQKNEVLYMSKRPIDQLLQALKCKGIFAM